MNRSRTKGLPIVLIIILAVLLYWYYTRQTNGITTGTRVERPIGAEAVVFVKEIEELRLDDSFLKSEAFTGLRDFSVVVPIEPLSRRNPFAPLEGVRPASARSR